MKQIILFPLLLMLAACSGELSPEGEKAAPIETLSDGDIKAAIIGEKEPNSYRVILSWTKNLGTVKVVDDDVESFTATQKILRPGKVGGYVSTFEITQDATGAKVKLDVPIPQDKVWDGNVGILLPTSLHVGRLFFRKDAVIEIGERNLEIIADEIISEGAVIQNFEPGRMGSKKSAGRNGGHIRVLAAKASGRLEIRTSGENGVDGIHGWPTPSGGCPGTNGMNGGSSGSIFVQIAEPRGFQLVRSSTPGAGGRHGRQGGAYAGIEEAVYPPCDPSGSQRFDGVSGQPGMICVQFGSEDLACE